MVIGRLTTSLIISGQNLYSGTLDHEFPWVVDFKKIRIYLKDKYNVTEAYYYVGYKTEKNHNLYKKIEEAGFILRFRQHTVDMKGKKKGNVDSDIIFEIMRKLHEQEPFDKVVLVSGDGDYFMLVDYLLKKGRFEKILFPNPRYASSLYKAITYKYFDNLSRPEIMAELKKEE